MTCCMYPYPGKQKARRWDHKFRDFENSFPSFLFSACLRGLWTVPPLLFVGPSTVLISCVFFIQSKPRLPLLFPFIRYTSKVGFSVFVSSCGDALTEIVLTVPSGRLCSVFLLVPFRCVFYLKFWTVTWKLGPLWTPAFANLSRFEILARFFEVLVLFRVPSLRP